MAESPFTEPEEDRIEVGSYLDTIKELPLAWEVGIILVSMGVFIFLAMAGIALCLSQVH